MHQAPRLLLATHFAFVLTLAARGEDWPQWLGPKRDSVWRETGIVDKFPVGGPKVLWRAKVAYGYAGPAVADGLVYVLDYTTDVDVTKRGEFDRKPMEGKERILCLNAKDGKEVWKHEYPCTYTVSYAYGPRCTPTVADGKVYALGAEGNFTCLDAKKGTVIWSKDFTKDLGAETAVWGYSSHPLVDGKKVICVVGTKEGVARAFDKDTGKEVWKAVSAKDPGYSPPTIIEAAGKRQLLIWTGEDLNSLDPETGKSNWSVPLATATAMSIMTPRKLGDYLFVGGRSSVSVLLKVTSDKPEQVWKGSRDVGMGPINMTPFLEDGVIYGVDNPGIMMALDLQNGKRLWQTTKPVTGTEKPPGNSGTAFLVKNEDRFFIFAETGDLIIAKLSRKGYEEIDRWKMLEPTSRSFGRKVLWMHPAFADKCVFARNDQEIVCVSLAK